MWLTSKIKQVLLVLRPGVVTLPYPFGKSEPPKDFRGAPVWDHHKCVGCGGCADHCVARCILVRDVCQELRVMLYDGSRCTYCGRCADLCPEKAIVMSPAFELACDQKEDVTTRLELFMLTCQRCGRCYEMENKNAIDRMSMTGFRYDHLEQRAMIKKSSALFSPEMIAQTSHYARPEK